MTGMGKPGSTKLTLSKSVSITRNQIFLGFAIPCLKFRAIVWSETTRHPKRQPVVLALFWLSQPGGNITLTMENAPDIDMVVTLNVKHQIGIPFDLPKSKIRQTQFTSITRRSRCGITPNVTD